LSQTYNKNRKGEELVGEYAWIEFTPSGEAHNTVEYTLWINWLNGSLYAKRLVLTDLVDYLDVLELEINQAVNDFITHLEKLE